MKIKNLCVLFLVIGMGIFFYCSLESSAGETVIKKQVAESPALVRRAPDFGKIPLYFIPNKGQVDKKVLFYARTLRYTLWMTKEGLVFDHVRGVEQEDKNSPYSIKRDVSRLIFLGSSKSPEIVPLQLTAHKFNYFKGKNRAACHQGVPTSKAVLYKNIYNNIDLKVYGIENQLEYDWIVKAGGNPPDICFKYQHQQVKASYIDQKGNLVVDTPWGRMLHKKPVAYQDIDGKRVFVKALFKKIKKNCYGFTVNSFDSNYDLVIDPVVSLIYSTYLGGSSWEGGNGLAVDDPGNIYMTGSTYSTDFPTKDAFQPWNLGVQDVFLTKLNADGSDIVFSTYFGGSNDDDACDIAITDTGIIYIAGSTYSYDLMADNMYNGSRDAFVARFTTSGFFLGACYVGGTGADYCAAIALDSSGNPVIAGTTHSDDLPLFNPYQNVNQLADVFICKLSPYLSDILYATYLGGNSSDGCSDILMDDADCYFVTGETASTDFPLKNAYQESNAGRYDAFVCKLNPDGSDLVFSTYLGTPYDDYGENIAVGAAGALYVLGNVYNAPDDDTSINSDKEYIPDWADGFISKYTADGSDMVYFRYLGGSSVDIMEDLTVSGLGFVYITGYTSSPDFPVKNPYQETFAGGTDAFITVLLPDGSDFLFSTFFGGTGVDRGWAIKVDEPGNLYIQGTTDSTDFPVVNPFQGSLTGKSDGFISRFSFSGLLIVNSLPEPGVTIQVTPLDNQGNGDGITDFIRTYNPGTAVSLKAPNTFNGMHFQKWRIDDVDDLNRRIQVTTDTIHQVTAVYREKIKLHVHPKTLTFNYHKKNGNEKGTVLVKTFYIKINKGDTPIQWTVTEDASWLECSPETGIGSGEITVTIDASDLAPGNYTADINIHALKADNSPQTVRVKLHVH